METRPHTHGLPGKFIAVEGGEGVGKSVQVKLLKESLPRRYPHHEIIFVHEPGGTPFADLIRGIIIQGMRETDARTLFALFLASRFDHTKKVIIPALTRGAAVVSDRYEGSTFAYQVFAQRAEDLHALFYSHQQLVPVPDLTLVLEVPSDVVLARVAKRKGQKATAFDLEAREFHDRLVEGFRWYAKFNSKQQIKFVDGNRPEDQVHDDFLRHIAAVLS
ncbi:dTMP kinase [Candidatus Kaiserbacteria bacterium]|nr:dTMP kinase [Candidatus Kaiserbacteria bacterium]